MTKDQADRIEKKLDIIIDHFNIAENRHRSPVEIRMLARLKHERRLERERKKKERGG
jgi:hypothetical protein